MSDIDDSLDDLGLGALLDFDSGETEAFDEAGDELISDAFSEDSENGESDDTGESSDDGDTTKKSSKKGKKKKKKDPEKSRVRFFLFLIFVIVAATAYFGFTLIKAANYLGILVIVAGLSLAVFLLVTNMVKLKLYERVKDRTQKSEITESEKLDEDMEKCRGRISALDERAAEWAKDHPAGGDDKK